MGILNEPELHLAADVVVPALAGWRRERLPALPEEAYFSVAPDWVCEVLPPSTASMDLVKNLTIYAREQVRHAWLVDPLARTIEVLRLESGRWSIVSTFADLDVVRAEPFDAMELDRPPSRAKRQIRISARNGLHRPRRRDPCL